jgi:CRP/FNR family nitrogen fixation transcriptional regulator
MAERLSEDFELPMSRRDIADYLGLTVETVSRTFTQLEQDRLIAMPTSRHIVILNPAALRDLNDCIAA